MIVTKYYKVHISCVDGETYYSMGSFHTTWILSFLKRHDHEGSSIELEVKSFDENRREVEDLAERFTNEGVYNVLRGV